MKFIVLLFARAKELAGTDSVDVELPEEATVGELRTKLAVIVPALTPILPHLFFAVNEDFTTDDMTIPHAATIACFPAVSGG